MSYRTDKPIDVTVTHGGYGWRFFGGPFRSILYPSEAAMAAELLRRFPNATVDGQRAAEKYAALPAPVTTPIAPEPAPAPIAPEPAPAPTPTPAPVPAAAHPESLW